MAKDKIKTVHPSFLKELRWTVDQVRRMVRGNLSNSDRRPDKSPEDAIIETPAEGLKSRSTTSIYGEDCAVYRQTDPVAGTRTVEAIEDGTGAAYELPVFVTEEAPMGGAVFWPSGRLKSGARHLDPGPDHVIGKLAGVGVGAATIDDYGVWQPGSGTLNLHYHDTVADAIVPWTIGGVQQTIPVYQWHTTPIANTSMLLIAHRDRWLKWWIMPPPAAATLYLLGTGNGVFSATPLTSYAKWDQASVLPIQQAAANVPVTGIASGLYATGEFLQLNPTGTDANYQITADWSGGTISLNTGTTYPEYYTVSVDWQYRANGGSAWTSVFAGASRTRRYVPFLNSNDPTGQSQTIVRTLGHTFFRCVLTLTKASGTTNTLYWTGDDWAARFTLQVIPK